MTRTVRVGAAQLGPIARDETRSQVVERLLALMHQAHGAGCDLVVFTELTLTTFFPRWVIEDSGEIDSWFEREMPGAETQALFDAAKRLGIGFHLGYAELTEENGVARHYNTAILVGKDGAVIGKYRKIHLPGTAEPVADAPGQHLEKRYFDVGNLGWPVWRAFGGVMGMCICNAGAGPRPTGSWACRASS